MINWEEIRREYEETKVTLAVLAEKYNIKIGTIKSRKSREGWSRDAPRKDATKSQKVATVSNRDATIKTESIKAREVFVESDELTDRQRLFCIYYVKSFNATQAAIKAGYSPSGAHVEGSRLLRNPNVAAEIKRLKNEMTSELFISAIDVLNKYIKIAFADITDFVSFGQKDEPLFDQKGKPLIDPDTGEQMTFSRNFVSFKSNNEVDGTIIGEVKQGKDGVSIKLHDKTKALDKLAQYFDLFPDEFKRKIEEEKLKLAQRKLDTGDGDEVEDDGFLEALKGKVSEVWADDEED